MKKIEPESIGSILSKFLDSSSIAIAASEGSVRDTWSKITGEYIAASTCDAFLKDGVLTLSFTKSTVKAEVLMHRKAYIEAMNRELGGNMVRSIRLM